MKNKKLSVLLALVISAVTAAGVWASEEAPLNPAFVKYMEETQGKSSMGQSAGGRVPSPVDLSHLAGVPVFESQGKKALFPVSYDLRTLGLVTPVRNQSPYGACWTFSAMASLESSALKAGISAPDYAEQFLAYYGFINQSNELVGFGNYSASDFPGVMDLGGDDFRAIAILARGTGAVNESSAPYGSTAPSPTATVTRSLRHVYYFYMDPSTWYQKANVENIKNALMTYGAVSVGMYAGDPQGGDWDNSPYYNPATYASYIPVGNSAGLSVGKANHAVTIVGWDDGYSKDNFNALNRPTSDGAWIVKNSWGASWGDQGYFHISYSDAVLDTGAAYVGGDPSEYNLIYQYDPLGWCNSYKPSGMSGNTAWMANVFTATTNTDLKAVSFYTGGVGNTYSIYVYTGSDSGPTSGTKFIDGQSGTLQEPGYHTVPLSSVVALDAGQKFSVVVRLDTPGYGYPVAVEQRVTGYSEKVSASAGHSYISANGSTWTDMTSVNSTASVCLKALGTRRGYASTGSLKVIIEPASAVSAGAAWSIDGGSSWYSSGDTVHSLATGNYTITFRQLSGWNTKVSENMPVWAGGSSTLTATYTQGGSILGSGGGCSMGLAPASILLVLPLLMMRKR